MYLEPGVIVFVDNSLKRIGNSILLLKGVYKNTRTFNNERKALEFIFNNRTDIILLNLDIHPNDALALTKDIRSHKLNPDPFIVIYSEKQDDFIHEMAFSSGIDSFINFHTKPLVLSVYIKNLMKRRPAVQMVSNKPIVVDQERFLVLKKGKPVQLPRKEFKVFDLLYNQPQKFFSKQEIASQIWLDEKIANKRNIDVHIYNIRRLLGKTVIQSCKGKGYRMNGKFIVK